MWEEDWATDGEEAEQEDQNALDTGGQDEVDGDEEQHTSLEDSRKVLNLR